MNITALPRKLVVVYLSFLVVGAWAASPYAGEASREIKALSAEEVNAYEAGKGQGFAKAAELNGFAGPAHVLELAAQLHLTAEQRALTEALFASMQAKAVTSGRNLVVKERELDHMFASKEITADRLASSLQEIGAVQAQLRDVHLEAHLAQVRILTPEQNVLYSQLSGYTSPSENKTHQHQH